MAAPEYPAVLQEIDVVLRKLAWLLGASTSATLKGLSSPRITTLTVLWTPCSIRSVGIWKWRSGVAISSVMTGCVCLRRGDPGEEPASAGIVACPTTPGFHSRRPHQQASPSGRLQHLHEVDVNGVETRWPFVAASMSSLRSARLPNSANVETSPAVARLPSAPAPWCARPSHHANLRPASSGKRRESAATAGGALPRPPAVLENPYVAARSVRPAAHVLSVASSIRRQHERDLRHATQIPSARVLLRQVSFVHRSVRPMGTGPRGRSHGERSTLLPGGDRRLHRRDLDPESSRSIRACGPSTARAETWLAVR